MLSAVFARLFERFSAMSTAGLKNREKPRHLLYFAGRDKANGRGEEEQKQR
jgi:hypothetical protein